METEEPRGQSRERGQRDTEELERETQRTREIREDGQEERQRGREVPGEMPGDGSGEGACWGSRAGVEGQTDASGQALVEGAPSGRRSHTWPGVPRSRVLTMVLRCQ